MDDPDLIDLPPSEWKSERGKPKEPFFGPGFPMALLYGIVFLAAVTIAHYLRN